MAFATLSYTLRFTSGKPPKDLLYKWSTVAGTPVPVRDHRGDHLRHRRSLRAIAGEVLALRRPTSWRTAIRIGIGVGIGILVLSLILTPLLEPGREQGVTPDTWQPEHAGGVHRERDRRS